MNPGYYTYNTCRSSIGPLDGTYHGILYFFLAPCRHSANTVAKSPILVNRNSLAALEL